MNARLNESQAGIKISRRNIDIIKYANGTTLGRKVMTNLDSIVNSRDMALLTKVRLVKAMVFPVVMYGWES